ncbi:TetR/AcrR family transcriptional regulator [Virgibacillus proomii]|uniref:TetR/AcrR family transcriptional regulator n=1 Tax=Virgibacillus proomii TaxID=84407 RepID=UPI001C105BCB|nr:TetR/AcrR family transcriptional regulator [Virgibacillus proomii]MBU5267435.1 TetR/AcrR family transcriptional regulator [Virgibacillus proomii]
MRHKIIETSVQLFESRGFSQTSIQDIVDQLRVTKGTFYYYFNSKEQLLMEIHSSYIEDLIKRQQQIMQQPMTNQEKLKAIIVLLIYDIKDKGASGRVFFREMRHLINENMDIIKQKRKQFRWNIETIVRHGVKSGEFRNDLRADMVTFGILGLINYSYKWYDPDGEVTADELVGLYSKILLQGILK